MGVAYITSLERKRWVRIGIDIRRAYSAKLRENLPVPTIDHLLPIFVNAKVFS